MHGCRVIIVSSLWLCFSSRPRKFQLGAALITKINNIQVGVLKNPILQEWDWTSLICKQQQFEDHQSDCLFYLCLKTRAEKIGPEIIDDCQNLKQVFTGVLVTFKQIFTGVPNISKSLRFSRKYTGVPVTVVNVTRESQFGLAVQRGAVIP